MVAIALAGTTATKFLRYRYNRNSNIQVSEQIKLEIIKILLAAKASVIHQDNRGLTALHIAAERNLPEVIDLLLPLLEAHHINAITKRMKLTPLMVAVHHNAVEAVKKLLENKHCDKYKKDLVGYFPLHYAVVNKSKEMVELILKHSEEMSSYFEENGVHQNVLDTAIASALVTVKKWQKDQSHNGIAMADACNGSLQGIILITGAVGSRRKLASYDNVRQVAELLVESTNNELAELKKKKKNQESSGEDNVPSDSVTDLDCTVVCVNKGGMEINQNKAPTLPIVRKADLVDPRTFDVEEFVPTHAPLIGRRNSHYY